MTPTLPLPTSKTMNWPLMKNNITRADLDSLIEFLEQDDPILTQSQNVRAFEQEWADWVGVKHCVFLNSGASANLLTITAPDGWTTPSIPLHNDTPGTDDGLATRDLQRRFAGCTIWWRVTENPNGDSVEIVHGLPDGAGFAALLSGE